MWIAFAAGSAIFAGLTAILAKCGIKNTDSNVATALRTIVVLIFSWLMVFVAGAQNEIGNVSGVVFHEKLSVKAGGGLILIVAGTLMLLL